MIRCGIAGTGRGAAYVPAIEKNKNAEIISICAARSSELEHYRNYQTFTEFRRFLQSGLDLIILATPGPLHASQAQAALEAGIHVLCETPAVYSPEEADAVAEAAKKGSARFMLAENYLWMGYFERLTSMKEQGLLGEIYYAEGSYLHDLRDLMLQTEDGYIPYRDRSVHPGARKSWRAESLPPILYTSHLAGPILTLMDDRITWAECRGIFGRTVPDLEVPDLQTAVFGTEKNNLIRLTAGFTAAHPFSFAYKLVGTEGTAILENRGTTVLTYYSDRFSGETGWRRETVPFADRDDGRSETEAMMDSVIDGLTADGSFPLTFSRSMDFSLPGAAAVRSWESGGQTVMVSRSGRNRPSVPSS
ncbi:MAG: Gfo/Idh/MocA family protein [Spirochaetia bacterium]